MINLGSPDSTSIPDVKKYLDEFLMDKRVIGKSYLFRWILVKLIILNTRPRKSAKAYKKIWWKEGSPLIVLSKRLFNNSSFFSLEVLHHDSNEFFAALTASSVSFSEPREIIALRLRTSLIRGNWAASLQYPICVLLLDFLSVSFHPS